MSAAYNLEPNPTAKVVLKTTAGDLSLELFAKQTPITSRNFLQLCLDGYYDGTVFHRLVPDFIVQGGDPTGTGSGGQSSFEGGKPFEDEFFSRLRFNRRGLLGMANSGTKNDNGSQFFLTLGKAEELTGRNTMFGRIEGNTIYNLVKIGESELVEGEGSDRPVYPTRVTGTEILVNPFEDMVKRTQTVKVAEKPSKSEIKKRPKKKAGKAMLSFGVGDEDEEDGALAQKPKFNSKLVQSSESTQRPVQSVPVTKSVKSTVQRSASPEKQRPAANGKPKEASAATAEESDEDLSASSPEPEDRKVAKLAKTNAQVAELKQSLKREVPKPDDHGNKRQKTSLEYMIPAGAKRGVKRAKPGSKEEQKQLDAFNTFQTRLGLGDGENVSSRSRKDRSEPSEDGGEADATNGEAKTTGEEDVCDLHFVPNCQSCKKWDEAEDDDEDLGAGSLMGHTLTFAKDRLGKDLEWKRQNEKELVVIDPREREKEILGDQKRSRNRPDR